MKTNTDRRGHRPDRDLHRPALRRRRRGRGVRPAQGQGLERAAGRYAALLPALQRGLPVPEAYKRERPGTDSDLNAYDALYYAGDANAGSKTIAINLPNDEEVQLRKGTRRLQLKNVMRAKFDRILVPIAGRADRGRPAAHIKFDAFFANVMFHEVAHGLGIKRTIDGKGTVRAALKEQASALEEGKADILGLYMVTRLLEQEELTGTTLEDHYVTFLASIFRSIRFGAGRGARPRQRRPALLLRGAGRVQPGLAAGRYRVDFPRMRAAVDSLGALDPPACRATATTPPCATSWRHAARSSPSCRATWRGSAARASRWTSSSSRARTSWAWGAEHGALAAAGRAGRRGPKPRTLAHRPAAARLSRRGRRRAVDASGSDAAAGPRRSLAGGGGPFGDQGRRATRWT